MSYTDFDVAVIGASIAGAITTLELSQDRLRVALFDKSAFPRRKPCGEGLSSFGFDALKRYALTPNGFPVQGFRIWKDGRSEHIGRDVRAYGISRMLFDQQLLDGVNSRESVQVFLREKIRYLVTGEERVQIETSHRRVSARVVIIADGVRSLSASRLGVPASFSRNMRYGASVPCRSNACLDSVQIILRKGYELYLTPITPGEINLSFLGTQRRLGTLLQSGSLENEILRLKEELGMELIPIQPLTGVGAIASLSRPTSSGRALLVGDACEAIDPVCGMGMTHAILSAQLAGAALRSYLSGRHSWCDATEQYRTEHSTLARQLRGYSRVVHTLVSRFQNLPLLRLAERSGLSSAAHRALLLHDQSLMANMLSTIGKVGQVETVREAI